MHRTTVLLDEESQKAARRLAAHLNVSPSEAMRRALIAYQASLLGSSKASIRRRRALLDRLVEVSVGGDPAEEIRGRKEEDEFW
jgi:hypothetical protein